MDEAGPTSKNLRNKKSNESTGKNSQERFELLLQQAENFATLLNDDSETKENGKKTRSQTIITKFPGYLALPLKDFQIDGLNWLIRIYENGLNAILADEMGLGKTVQTIALLAYLYHKKKIRGKHLIFGPKSVIVNWIQEFERFCPDFRVVGYFGTKEDKKAIEQSYLKTNDFDVLITNYEQMLLNSRVFAKIKWNYIIVDEGHRLKNEKSSFSQNIRKLESSNRLILTGTPLQNSVHELWALLNFLMPQLFNSSEDFDKWFDTSAVLDDGGNLIERLKTILRPFLLRRMKSDVATNLLPKVEYKLFTGLTRLQKELYIKVLKKEYGVYRGAFNTFHPIKYDKVLTSLRQLCQHPYLLEGVEPQPFVTDESLINCSGKLILLDKLLTMLKEQESKVLIFSQFIGLLDVLEDYLIMKKFSYCRLDGSTDYDQRSEDIAEFNEEKSNKFVYLLSTKAGGLGINLQSADVVIVYDSDWNPQNDLQGIDRSHRIGQKKQVRVFTLICEDTVDERIVQRAAIKLELDRKVIREGRFVKKDTLSAKEMLGLIYADKDKIMSSAEATITDETIQEIMKRSVQKSKELEEMIKTSQLNFESFDTIFKFEGESYTSRSARSSLSPYSSTNFTPTEPARKRQERKREEEIETIELSSDLEDDSEEIFIKQEPIENLSKPELLEHQFYDPNLLPLLEQEYYHFLKRKSNKISRKLFEKLTEEEKEEVEASTALTLEELRAKQKYLKNGFNWTREEFQQYFDGLKKHGRRSYASLALCVPTKSLAEVKEYNSAFWKKFIEIQDTEVRLFAFKGIYKDNWQTTVESVFEKCKGNFNSLTHSMCTGNLFHLEFIKFVLKKLFYEVSTNPNIVQEISAELANNKSYTRKLSSKGVLTRYKPFDKKFLTIINKVLESFKPKKPAPRKSVAADLDDDEDDSNDGSEWGGSEIASNYSDDTNSRASLNDF